MTRLKSFGKLSRFNKVWLGPAWVLTGLSRAASVFPFSRRLMWSLGLEQRSLVLPLLDAAQTERARQIKSVVLLASRYTPWDSNCFSQAGAARCLLFFYGIPYSVFLGVRRHDVTGGLASHIWIAADRVAICGDRSFDFFSVLGCFYYEGRS